jgi:hypothetical protein
MHILRKFTVREENPAVKYLVMQRSAERFNSGVKGLRDCVRRPRIKFEFCQLWNTSRSAILTVSSRQCTLSNYLTSSQRWNGNVADRSGRYLNWDTVKGESEEKQRKTCSKTAYISTVTPSPPKKKQIKHFNSRSGTLALLWYRPHGVIFHRNILQSRDSALLKDGRTRWLRNAGNCLKNDTASQAIKLTSSVWVFSDPYVTKSFLPSYIVCVFGSVSFNNCT